MQLLPLVTVVTVTYNSGKFIRDAIESILNSSYGNFELIIGDDCSTDNTWEIIEGYYDNRIIKYRNPKNIGEYPNRNKAIELAKGEYLIFIDGDDIIYANGITFFVEMMKQHPMAAMAIQKGYYNNIVFPVMLKPEEVLTIQYVGKNHLLSCSFTSTFFKTSVLKKLKLKTRFISGDDEVRLRIASMFPVLFVAGWVSWPRETPGQASQNIKQVNAICESYVFVHEILSNDEIKFNPCALDAIKQCTNSGIARFAIRSLIRLNLRHYYQIRKVTGFSLFETLAYCFSKSLYKNPMSEYTAANPLRGTLDKIATER